MNISRIDRRVAHALSMRIDVWQIIDIAVAWQSPHQLLQAQCAFIENGRYQSQHQFYRKTNWSLMGNTVPLLIPLMVIFQSILPRTSVMTSICRSLTEIFWPNCSALCSSHIIGNRILTFSKAENISISPLATYQVIGSLSAEQNVVAITTFK